MQPESATWAAAITRSGLVWARAPQPWPARERAALMAGYLRAVADWVVLPPSARWSRLMRAGGSGWPVGLSRPLADTGTLLRYAMGKSACAIAGLRPELVGRAVPVLVLDPAERGACPDVVLRVGPPPSLQGTALEVVLPPPPGRCSRAFPFNRSGTGPCRCSRQARHRPASSLHIEPRGAVIGESSPLPSHIIDICLFDVAIPYLWREAMLYKQGLKASTNAVPFYAACFGEGP